MITILGTLLLMMLPLNLAARSSIIVQLKFPKISKKEIYTSMLTNKMYLNWYLVIVTGFLLSSIIIEIIGHRIGYYIQLILCVICIVMIVVLNAKSEDRLLTSLKQRGKASGKAKC